MAEPLQIRVTFPGKKVVAAHFKGMTVLTDQPTEAGGDGSAPGPFDLFLASIATCAGIFVLGFCQKRGLSTEGLAITQSAVWNDQERRVTHLTLEITPPAGFPEKYRETLAQTANLCTVKRHIYHPPLFKIVVREPDSIGG